MAKNLTKRKSKKNHYLWMVNSLAFVAMVMAPCSTRSIKMYSLVNLGNFGYLEVRSFQIMFTNTCILENCVWPPQD